MIRYPFNYVKWYNICREADNVASEVLRDPEAKEDLTAEEMRMLLHEFGDDEYVVVLDNKEIIPIEEST